MSDHVIGLARLVADRCEVELGFDAEATMFRATFLGAGLVVRWAGDVALVTVAGGEPQAVHDLARLVGVCDAALADLPPPDRH